MAETREALLRAGAELFGEHGLDGPSLDDICAAAGKTRGAFYVHFEDRDAFLVAVMEQLGLPLLDEIFGATDESGARAGGGAPVDLMTVALRFVSAVGTGAYPLTREGGVRPHQLIDACVRSSAIRSRYVGFVGDAIDRLAAVVRADQQRGELREDVDPRDLSTLMLAAVIGAQTMLELGVPLDLARAGASLFGALARDRSGAKAAGASPAPRSARARKPAR